MEKSFNEKTFNEIMSCKKSDLIFNIDNKFIVHKIKDNKSGYYQFTIWDESINQYEFSSCKIDTFCKRHLSDAKLSKSFATHSIEFSPNGVKVIKHENNN